jgi:hypothetical protein
MQLLQRMAIYMLPGKELNPPRKSLHRHYQGNQYLTTAVNLSQNLVSNEYGVECMMFVAERTLMRLGRYQ